VAKEFYRHFGELDVMDNIAASMAILVLTSRSGWENNCCVPDCSSVTSVISPVPKRPKTTEIMDYHSPGDSQRVRFVCAQLTQLGHFFKRFFLSLVARLAKRIKAVGSILSIYLY